MNQIIGPLRLIGFPFSTSDPSLVILSVNVYRVD